MCCEFGLFDLGGLQGGDKAAQPAQPVLERMVVNHVPLYFGVGGNVCCR